MNEKNKKLLEELADIYIPYQGPAKYKIGEILRAFARIRYRFWNDGDRVGIDYGKETCNSPARYLIYNTNNEIAYYIESKLWEKTYDENQIDELGDLIYEYIYKHNQIFTEINDDNCILNYIEPEDTMYDDEEYDEY